MVKILDLIEFFIFFFFQWAYKKALTFFQSEMYFLHAIILIFFMIKVCCTEVYIISFISLICIYISISRIVVVIKIDECIAYILCCRLFNSNFHDIEFAAIIISFSNQHLDTYPELSFVEKLMNTIIIVGKNKHFFYIKEHNSLFLLLGFLLIFSR